MTPSTKPEVHIVSQSAEKDRATVTNKVQWFWHVVLDMRANRHLGINYFAAAGLNELSSPSRSYRQIQAAWCHESYTDNVGTIFCYQISNMILVDTTLLLVHFLYYV